MLGNTRKKIWQSASQTYARRVPYHVFSISCYSGNGNTSFVKILRFLAITIYEIQPGDRQTEDGGLVIGSRFTRWVRNPKKEGRMAMLILLSKKKVKRLVWSHEAPAKRLAKKLGEHSDPMALIVSFKTAQIQNY